MLFVFLFLGHTQDITYILWLSLVHYGVGITGIYPVYLFYGGLDTSSGLQVIV